MEWWILLGLAPIAGLAMAALRLRRRRRAQPDRDRPNIYPLW